MTVIRASSRPSPLATVSLAAVLALAGLLFATSAHTSRSTPLRTDRNDLASLEAAERARLDAKVLRVQQLNDEVQALTAARARTSGPAASLRAQFDQLAPAAGLGPVTGPAYRITLDDAPADGTQRAGVRPDELVVHQQDVQAVVNAMWRGGASALMVMDQRIISTSAIRCVGNTLILQGRVYSPPYAITAIGDKASLVKALAESPEIGIYREYVDLLGLVYKPSTPGTTTFPAFAGPVTLRYATPATPAPGTSSSSGASASGSSSSADPSAAASRSTTPSATASGSTTP